MNKLIPLFVILAGCTGPLRQYSECKSAEMAGGAHFVYDDEYNRVLVAAQERRKKSPSGEYFERGEIYRISLSNFENPAPMKMQGRDDFPFHPSGLALVQGRRPVLLVINNALKKLPAIEKYSVKKSELVFLGRIFSEELSNPEYITAISENEFYVTNLTSARGFTRFLEAIFGLKFSTILHYRNGEFQRVSPGSSDYAGLAISRDRSLLFAARRSGSIQIFNRNSGDGLAPAGMIGFSGRPDALALESSGHLIVPVVNSRFRSFWHSASASFEAPSRVWRLDPDSGATELVFNDPGKNLNGISSAAILSGQLVLAQRYDGAMYSCK